MVSIDKASKLAVEEISAQSCSAIQVQEDFEVLYKKITGEDKPDNLRLLVLSQEDYIKNYRTILGEEPNIYEVEGRKGIWRGIGLINEDAERYFILVSDNARDFFWESVSLGIGKIRHLMEYHKSDPEGTIEDIDMAVTATASGIALQKYLDLEGRSGPTNPSKEVSLLSNEVAYERAKGYTTALIRIYGLDRAWEKILSVVREKGLKELLTPQLSFDFI